ncbi:MAG: PucC protein, partial [uncultured Acetobacteraceae bacterium]
DRAPGRRTRQGLDAACAGPAALRGRGDRDPAARPAAAAVAVPAFGRHGGGAAHRHAEPGDDRRARGTRRPRRRHGRVAAGLRALARAGGLQVRHAPLGARLAARALPLDGDAAAVRRPFHHALRAHPAVGRHAGPGLGRARRGGAGLPAGRCRAAHRADGGARAGDGPRAPFGAAARGGAALGGAPVRHGGERRRLRRATGGVQPDPVDPSDPGRRGGHGGAQRRRTVEAGSARPGADRGRRAAAGFHRRLARAAPTRAMDPPLGRRRDRRRRLQHAGRAAGALWRAGPAARCRRHHDADGAARGRKHRRHRRRGATARARPRAPPGRGARSPFRHRRLCRSRLRRALRLRAAVHGRHRPHRPRRRPVRARHAHRLHARGTRRPDRAGARRLGSGAGDGGRVRHRPRRIAARRRGRVGGSRRARRHAGHPRHGLRRGLPAGGRAALRHPGRHRPPRAHDDARGGGRSGTAAITGARRRRVPALV